MLDNAITEEKINRAKEVSRYFYESNIWKKYQESKEPVNLAGYINVIAKRINRSKGQLYDDFKVAHVLRYITIFSDKENQRLYLREGANKKEIYVNRPDSGGIQ
ncbi:MAG: hypothetical protein K6U80_10680 [Firmicutes bacterium]|nr:hypothetical protein [Bacillota bacterium]